MYQSLLNAAQIFFGPRGQTKSISIYDMAMTEEVKDQLRQRPDYAGEFEDPNYVDPLTTN